MKTQGEVTVAIVGAGYAGVMAANRFRSSLTAAERARVRVVMVNRTGTFLERIRLHQVAAGTLASATRPLAGILHEDVDVLVGDVVQIDPDKKLLDIMVDDGARVLAYDLLIYAVGSAAATGVPGTEAFAHLLGNADGADSARTAIAGGGPGTRIVVVGGGSTGVEAASEIAEHHPAAEVTLLSGGPILDQLPAGTQARVGRILERLGVRIRAGSRVARVFEDRIELEDGSRVPSDVTVWAAAFSVPGLARTSGLAVDGIGRLRVDESLRALDYPEIVGAGDAVRPPDSVAGHLRMSCAIALPLGGHAADTALALLRGTEPAPLDIGFLAQCISLGRKSGYVQFLHSDDTARPFHVSGGLAAFVKERICRMTIDGPQKERVKPGSFWAPKGPRRDAARDLVAR